MDNYSKIRQLMREVTGTDKRTFDFRLMEVVSVDGDICTAKIDDFEIPDIRLASIVDGSEYGILVTPSVDSIIAVADLSCGELRELLVIGYSEIDSIRIHIGGMTVTIDRDKIRLEVGGTSLELTNSQAVFNGGKNDGLVVIGNLVTKLNNIENDINLLKAALGGWVPANPAEPDASSLKGAITGWVAQPLTETQKSEIEDTKVTH